MNHLLLTFFDNGVLAWGLAACGLAQLSKLFIELLVHRRWRPAVLIETGGMPSSHSALVSGTAAAIGFEQGLESPLFALASTIAFVVMYDASGVRRAAGRTAERVNTLPGVEALPPLKTTLGHSRLEVLVGSLIGPLIALCGEAWVGTPVMLAQRLGWISGVG